jgi:alanine racemase
MLIYNDWTRAEISFDALENNYRAIARRLEPGCRVMAMVKADAYGHGAVPVARFLESLGIGYLGVANAFEAVSLRDAGIRAPVLIMGFTPPSLTGELIARDIAQTVQSAHAAKAYAGQASAAGKRLKVHLKLDTGMSRSGIFCPGREDEAAREAREVCALPGLEIEGAYTHFAESDGPDPAFTRRAIRLFSLHSDRFGGQRRQFTD